MISRSHVWKKNSNVGTLLYLIAGEAERQISGTHWPAILAYLVSSRLIRDPTSTKKKISGQNLRNTQGCLLDSIVMSVNAQYMHTHKCKLGMSIKVATVIFLVALRRPVDPTPT